MEVGVVVGVGELIPSTPYGDKGDLARARACARGPCPYPCPCPRPRELTVHRLLIQPQSRRLSRALNQLLVVVLDVLDELQRRAHRPLTGELYTPRSRGYVDPLSYEAPYLK